MISIDFCFVPYQVRRNGDIGATLGLEDHKCHLSQQPPPRLSHDRNGSEALHSWLVFESVWA